MSTATATPAAAAAPNGTAPAKTESKSVPADIRNRVLGARIIPPTEDEIKSKAEKDAADKKAADEKAAADKLAAETAAKPPVDKKPKKLKDPPPLPDKPAPAAPDVAELVRKELEAKEPKPVTPAANPEIDREVELARYAETKNPERYAGYATKVARFYDSRDQLIARKAKELGGQNSSEFKDYLDGDEWKTWVEQNKPAPFGRGDREKFKEEMITERARAEVTREMQPKFKELERKTAELEMAPRIRGSVEAAMRVIITDRREDKDRDPALDGFSKNPTKFGEEHPEEAQVIAAEAADAITLIEEVYKLDHDLVDFNPTARPQQQRIREFMIERNAELREKHPTGIPMQDGKIIVDADTYRERGLAKDPRYRIFNSDEIAGMIAVDSNAKIVDKLARRRVGVQKSIYATKTPDQINSPVGQLQQEPPSPGAVTSSAPGASRKPPEEDEKTKVRKKYL